MPISRPLRIAITVIYFISCCVLFFLPGSAFPKDDWLEKIYFDKWVHIGLLAVFALLLSWSGFGAARPLRIAACLICYGLLVEWIQGRWIANRSSDLLDALADTVGAGVGLLLWKRLRQFGTKNKPL